MEREGTASVVIVQPQPVAPPDDAAWRRVNCLAILMEWREEFGGRAVAPPPYIV